MASQPPNPEPHEGSEWSRLVDRISNKRLKRRTFLGILGLAVLDACTKHVRQVIGPSTSPPFFPTVGPSSGPTGTSGPSSAKCVLGATQNTAAQFGLAGRSYVDWTDRTSPNAQMRIAQLVPNGASSVRAINLRWSAKPNPNDPSTYGQAPFADVIAGKKDADIIAWAGIIKSYQGALKAAGLSRGVILTHHHEVESLEFAPGEDPHDWARSFVHCIDVFRAQGLKNIFWTSCLVGTAYARQQGDVYHTPELIDRLWAIGADAYGDIGNNTASKAFAAVISYAQSKGKDNVAILETACREPLDGSWHIPQSAWYQSLHTFLKTQRIIKACFLWNSRGDRFNDALEPDGVSVVASMAADPFFSRSPSP